MLCTFHYSFPSSPTLVLLNNKPSDFGKILDNRFSTSGFWSKDNQTNRILCIYSSTSTDKPADTTILTYHTLRKGLLTLDFASRSIRLPIIQFTGCSLVAIGLIRNDTLTVAGELDGMSVVAGIDPWPQTIPARKASAHLIRYYLEPYRKDILRQESWLSYITTKA
jgi:hypothetical protein